MGPACIPPNAKALLSYLENHFPGGKFYSAYESGFCGFSKHRDLMSQGINNIVFNAGDLKKSNKERIRKTDSVDCKSIWENLSKNQLTPIYIPTESEEEDRELVRGRESCIKDLRRMKQRIKMFLYKLDADIPEDLCKAQASWSKAYLSWLSEYANGLRGGNRTRLESMLQTLSHLKERMSEYERQMHLAVEARHKEIAALLMTIPGIGKLSAAKICLELMNFSRFANDRHLAGYIGLVPDCMASDSKETIIGTSCRRNRILKSTLVEASWKAISKDKVLGSAYARGLGRGQHPNVAITAIARRMVTRLLYVYRTGKPFEYDKK